MHPPAEVMAPEPVSLLLTVAYLMAALAAMALGGGLVLGLVARKWGPLLGGGHMLLFALLTGIGTPLSGPAGLLHAVVWPALALIIPIGALGGWMGWLIAPSPEPPKPPADR